MANITSTSVAEVPIGYNQGNVITFEAQILATTVSAADTVDIALPARWAGKGFQVIAVSAEKYTISGASVGSRVRTAVALTVTTVTESATAPTVRCTFSGTAANTTNVLLKLQICTSS